MITRDVYTDCEFLPADVSTGGLVSIGITDDQGRDYYAVNYDMDVEAVLAVPWMVENVWPSLPLNEFGKLDLTSPYVKPLWEIRADIAAYFEDTTADATRLYAYYGAQDIVRLHSLWDGNWGVMPKAVPRSFVDLREMAVDAGEPRMPKQAHGAHNALEDARHNRTMHQFLINPAPRPDGSIISPLHEARRRLARFLEAWYHAEETDVIATVAGPDSDTFVEAVMASDLAILTRDYDRIRADIAHLRRSWAGISGCLIKQGRQEQLTEDDLEDVPLSHAGYLQGHDATLRSLQDLVALTGLEG